MTVNFLKNYMDLDEFLAVKDLCTGLSRTESDYSEDEDLVNFIDKEDIPSECGLSSRFEMNNSSLATPSMGSTSDTDEGRGDSVSGSENPASMSSSESLTSLNENNKTPRKRKRKAANNKEKSAPRKRRRKTADGAKKSLAEEGATLDENGCETAEGVLPGTARQSVDETSKDDKYWERRRKNNQAAKRSRDLKRQKEINVRERADSLEEENRQLREEVQKLKEYLKTLDEKFDK